MDRRDGFTSGFIIGTFVGGIIGSITGVLVASWRTNVVTLEEAEARENAKLSDSKGSKGKRHLLKAPASEASIEVARRSLEDKIAQLNETIDEVRLTLGNVNGNLPEENTERSFTKDT